MSFTNLSIRAKLIALLVGLCATVLVVACGCFVYYDQTSTSAAKEATLTILADAIAGSASGPAAFQDAESAGYVLRTLDAEPTAMYAGVYVSDFDSGALVRLTEWGREGGPEAPEALDKVSTHLGYANNNLYLLRPIVSNEAEVGQLLVAFTTDDIKARSRQQLMIAGLILAVSVVGALLAASRVHRVISEPIDTLAGAARRVREDSDYAVRVDLKQRDELGVLADGFNAMLADIQSRDAELNAHREHLEELVAERTRDLDRRNAAMRLVLDNVDQGLATLSLSGEISSERSTRFDAWFGTPTPGVAISEHLKRSDEGFGDWMGLCWESLTDGFLPVELALDQLPSEGRLGERHCAFKYKAIEEDGELRSVLIIVSDMTAEVERKLQEERQRQLLTALTALSTDRQGFVEFMEDAEELVGALREPQPEELLKRRLHTLKGNSALVGLSVLAREVHALEDIQAERPLSDDELAGLQASWRTLADSISALVGQQDTDVVVMTRDELAALSELVSQRAPHALLAHQLTQLSYEPMADRLGRLGRQAEAFSRRLGRPSLTVAVEDNGVRLPAGPLSGVWGALSHVIRNAIDHGIEPPEARDGKPEAGTLTLRTQMVRGDEVSETPYRFGARLPADAVVCLLEIADDGRGIDWTRVAAAAAKRGLPVQTPADKVAALFSDGLSTRDTVTETSGRGVGTAAVAAAVAELGGAITVDSRPGEGSRFSFWLPLDVSADWRHAAVA